MNRILYSCFFVLAILFSKNNLAQTFWTEDFGIGCSTGNLATAGVPTATNGAWTVATLASGPGNGAQSNLWYISAEENGNPIGTCGSPCGANRTLHVSSFFADLGAAYLAGAGANTNIRAESPTINCTGQTGISLSFKYLTDGIAGIDFCEVLYSINNGGTWISLGNLLSSSTGPCLPQGTWASSTFPLPATVNNNPTVKIGFRWENNDPSGNDPSVAIDDIILFKPSSTLSLTTASTVCSNVGVAATISGTTAGTTSFTWTSNPAGPVFTGTTTLGTSATITYPSAGVYTVVVIGFVGAAPTYTAAQSVTVSTTPTVTIAPPSQTICAGNTATLTANSTAGSTYQWATGTFPAIIPLGTSSVQTTSPASNSTYTVVTSIGSCTAFASCNVVIGAGLTITGSASPTAGCSGSPVTLTAGGATSYTWVAPPSTTLAGNGSTQNVSPTVATTYSVYGSSGSCTGSTTIQTNISSGITLTVTASSATTCPGQPVTLTASGGVNYTWSPGSSLSSTSGSPVTATPTIATTYTVVGDNGASCTGTANITINMGSGATGSATASSYSVCAGFSSTLTAPSASGYTWTGTSLGGPVNQPSIAVGPGIYSYTASNGAGCDAVGSITIYTLGPLAINVVQSSPTTCIASNYPKYSHAVTFTASGASNYVWSVYVPSIMTNSLGATISVRPPTSTQYTVTGNTSTCSGTAVVTVTVIPQFTMSIIPKQPIICLGDSIKLYVASVGTLASLPIVNYVWYDPQPPSLDNPFNPTVTAYPSSTDTYSVEIYDSKACVSLPRLVTVTVLPQPVTAVSLPTIGGIVTNTICYVGDRPSDPNVNIQLTATDGNPPLSGVVPTYTWIPPYYGPPNPILTANPINGSPGSVIVSAPQKLPAIQTYTVKSGYNGVPGCVRYDTVSVIAVDCRSVTISSVHFTTATTNDTICSRNCVTFLNQSDTASGGPQTYTWTCFGGSPATSTLQSPTICYNLPGVYWVRLKVCNPYAKPGGSCATIAKNGFIHVVDVPNTTIVAPGNLASDQTIRFGETYTMVASGARSYIWTPDYRITSLTSPTVVVNPINTTQYIVTGYNSKGCSSSDTVNVIVINDCGEMFVPTAFSPNGDGTNDVLYVRGVCLETLNFMVFNRWGEKVFETTDIKKGWDGTYKGEDMNTGVFVYRLEGKTYDGKGFSSKGNVTLIR